MLGPISAYQVQQKSVQALQDSKPQNTQPALAQERNDSRTDRLNETKSSDQSLANSNRSQQNKPRSDQEFADVAKDLINQGRTDRGTLLDLIA